MGQIIKGLDLVFLFICRKKKRNKTYIYFSCDITFNTRKSVGSIIDIGFKTQDRDFGVGVGNGKFVNKKIGKILYLGDIYRNLSWNDKVARIKNNMKKKEDEQREEI